MVTGVTKLLKKLEGRRRVLFDGPVLSSDTCCVWDAVYVETPQNRRGGFFRKERFCIVAKNE